MGAYVSLTVAATHLGARVPTIRTLTWPFKCTLRLLGLSFCVGILTYKGCVNRVQKGLQQERARACVHLLQPVDTYDENGDVCKVNV